MFQEDKMKLLFTCAATLFLITNYCFADVFDTIQDTNTIRAGKYNTPLSATIDPKDPMELAKLSAETTKIDNLLTKNVNTKVHATKEQKKKALQAVFSAEIIYGSARPSYLDGISETDDIYGHCYVLEYSALLARECIKSMPIPGVCSTSLSPSKYKELYQYSGLDINTLTQWFFEIYEKHMPGTMTRFTLQNPELSKKAFPSKEISKPTAVNVAMEESDSTYTLKTVNSIRLLTLQQAGASVTYPWLTKSLGNMLNVIKGELKVTCPMIDNEQQITKLYQELNENITGGYVIQTVFSVKANSIKQGGARCFGGTGCLLTATENFVARQTLFGSNGNIEFSSPTFKFTNCFIDVDIVNTIFKIIPAASLNSPIEFLQIIPKKTPLFIQGEIDFRNLSFSNFIVSHSDFQLKFKDL
jgi:hypothetical protein